MKARLTTLQLLHPRTRFAQQTGLADLVTPGPPGDRRASSNDKAIASMDTPASSIRCRTRPYQGRVPILVTIPCVVPSKFGMPAAPLFATTSGPQGKAKSLIREDTFGPSRLQSSRFNFLRSSFRWSVSTEHTDQVLSAPPNSCYPARRCGRSSEPGHFLLDAPMAPQLQTSPQEVGTRCAYN